MLDVSVNGSYALSFMAGSTDARIGRAVPGRGAKGRAWQAYYTGLATWRLTNRSLLSGTLVVSGAPRSGTTWLGSNLARELDRPGLEEPTNPLRVPHFHVAFGLDGRPYRDPDADDPVFAEALGRLLAGVHLGPGLISRNRQTTTALWKRRPTVTKVITVNLLLPWMTRALPQVNVIEIVRNPLAVVSSQMSMRGTYWAQTTALSDPYVRLFEAQPHLAGPVQFDTTEEALATAWAAEHAYLTDQLDRLGRVCFVRYEDLIADPETELRRVCATFGLALPDQLDHEALTRPSRAVGPESATFFHGDSLRGYRNKLDPDQIDRILAVLERYRWPFYGPDEFDERRAGETGPSNGPAEDT